MNIDENEMSIHRGRGRERLLLLRRNRLEHSAVNYNGALKRPTGSRMLTKGACNSFSFNEEIRTANEGRFGNLKRRRLTWQRLINATSNKARNQRSDGNTELCTSTNMKFILTHLGDRILPCASYHVVHALRTCPVKRVERIINVNEICGCNWRV